MPNLKFNGILIFLKNDCGNSNFRKIGAIVLKLHINIIYPLRALVFNLADIDCSGVKPHQVGPEISVKSPILLKNAFSDWGSVTYSTL